MLPLQSLRRDGRADRGETIDRATRHARGASGCLLLAGAVLLLGGCGAEPPAPPAPAVASLSPAPVPSPAPTAERPDPCAALGRIVDAEAASFLALRSRPEGEGRWSGSIVPAGFADCWVEDLNAAAHYLCRAERFAPVPEAIAADHLALLTDLDACFARPIWFPLAWRRDVDETGADGSRRSSWRTGDLGPAVGLALAPHPDRPLFWNLLVVGPRAGRR